MQHLEYVVICTERDVRDERDAVQFLVFDVIMVVIALFFCAT